MSAPFFIGARVVVMVSEHAQNRFRVGVITRPIKELTGDGWVIECPKGGKFYGHKAYEYDPTRSTGEQIQSEQLGIAQWKLRPFVDGESVIETDTTVHVPDHVYGGLDD